MTTPTLCLASQSPRRRRMLGWLGIPFETTAADVDESPRPGEAPVALAARLARLKAEVAAADVVAGASAPDMWVLAADTVVDLEGRSLGKPEDADDVRRMLRRLREVEHQVHTGVALATGAGETPAVRVVTTRVRMRPYTDVEIEAYIATGDPMDKAGAYAIQHPGFHPVASIDRCYANVVGLPFGAVVRLLHDAGRRFRIEVPQLCYLHFGYRCDPPDEGRAL